MHFLSVVSLILSACQSRGIHKPVTASEDELWQQAVRVPGTAVCGLPFFTLPLCLPACSPSACQPFSSVSLSLLFPHLLPASLCLTEVRLGAAVLGGGTFLVSSLILMPVEQRENRLPMVQHLPLQPE